jgi:hypothetical protein
MTLLSKALASPFTQASFRTMSKHAARGAIDSHAALRLLRRNVRDVAPRVAFAIQHDTARQMLEHWRKLERNT